MRSRRLSRPLAVAVVVIVSVGVAELTGAAMAHAEESPDPSDPEAGPPPASVTQVDDPPDPDKAYRSALDGAQTVAVAEAQRLLAEVTGKVGTAEKALAEARATAADARAAEAQARRQLKLAEASAARTQREIDELTARAEATRSQVGVIARQAYQGSRLAAVGVVLGAETPAELAARVAGMRTLLRTGDSALGRMAADQAELRAAYARLASQRDQLKERAAEVGHTRAAMEAAEQKAHAAQEALEVTTGLVEDALQAAEDAKLEDYRRYMALLGESSAIGERLADLDYGPELGTGNFVRPGAGSVTSAYGSRLHPILGYVKTHTGLDLGRGNGRIYAADSGTVVEAGWNDAYGYLVVIDHGVFDGRRVTTMYAHQADLMVEPGQEVVKGQVIGMVGSTGYSTGPHLHFEVRLDGRHTDPWPWLKDAPPPA